MKKIFFILFTLVLSVNSFSQNLKVTERLQKKIQFLNPIEYTGVLILLNEQTDIESLDKELYRIDAPLTQRAQTVINTLKQKAEQTQGPVLEYLNSEKDNGKVIEIKKFWITNAIYVKATPDVIISLSKKKEIQIIDLDGEISSVEPIRSELHPDNSATESVENGLKVIKADVLWKLGITGAGRTVMNIDTGVDGLHPALSPRWWGNNGRAWYHAWFDPLQFTTSPSDCSDHGTHTMGTMCGRNSATGDTVGAAPDAYWMAAGIAACFGSTTSLLVEGFQWAMDPDSNSATMDMPDVINCSWRDLSIGGLEQCNSIYVSTLNAVEAAGIAVVFAAGNSGPNPSTIDPPVNINTDSLNIFSVGSIDGNTQGYPVAGFSSRGPSICGGSGTLLIKPEVSAPGVNVRSTVPGGTYGFSDGTSMAAPHVAGSIALLKQIYPNMTGRELKGLLFSTCKDLGIPGEDNDYGKGLIDLVAVLQMTGYLTLNSFNVNTPSAGINISSLPNSSTPFTISWDTSGTGAEYNWVFGNPTTATRLFTIPSNTNSITLTLGELDVMLANAGVAPGASLNGQWDVWSYSISRSDSLKSSNGPRALTLKRGIPDLSNFNLLTPVSGSSITTSAFNNSAVNINWSRSGKATTYKWKFGSPSMSNIKLAIDANDSGFDTSITMTNFELDGLLRDIGVNAGDSISGQWSVWAYNGSDSAKASQNFSLTLRREGQSQILVIYDSTNFNCRVSKDSIVANLNILQFTHQLYNRKGSQATNSVSFKGYDKLILIGEGNSIMSAAIKDSLKTYLNSGSDMQKAKLIIMGDDVGYQLDRIGSTIYDTVLSRSMCGFQYVADRPGPISQRGIVGVSINSGIADSSNGPSMDVLKRSGSVPSEQTYNLYKYRLFSDSMNAIGRISENYNTAVFAFDAESIRPAFDSPSGSPLKRILKGALDFVDEVIVTVNPLHVSSLPLNYLLSQNYPNPFNPSTRIVFSIPGQGQVTLKIYDVSGKEVMTLLNENKPAGNYEVEFKGSNLASGVYFYSLESGEFKDVKRMMLIK